MADVASARPVVVVAGSEDVTARIVKGLEAERASVVPLPTVRIVPPADGGELNRALREWDTFDWVVFTSANAVRAVAERGAALSIPWAAGRPKVAAVGPATRAAAEAAGLRVHAMPRVFLTEAIADALGEVRGLRILLPRSRRASPRLPARLRRKGAVVQEAEAYDVGAVAAPEARSCRVRDADFLVFTSPSAVQNFVGVASPEDLHEVRTRAEAVCIGPVTAAAARELGFRIISIASEHTVQGILRAFREVAARG